MCLLAHIYKCLQFSWLILLCLRSQYYNPFAPESSETVRTPQIIHWSLFVVYPFNNMSNILPHQHGTESTNTK